MQSILSITTITNKKIMNDGNMIDEHILAYRGSTNNNEQDYVAWKLFSNARYIRVDMIMQFTTITIFKITCVYDGEKVY